MHQRHVDWIARIPNPVGAPGFTLLEALLVAFIVSISLLAGISTLTHTLRGVQDNKQTLFAKTAINRVMERIRNVAWLEPDTELLNEPDDVDDFIGYAFSVSGLPGAQGDVTIDDYLGNPEVKRVTVTVEVDPSRTWSLSTLVTRWTTALAAASSVQYPPT